MILSQKSSYHRKEYVSSASARRRLRNHSQLRRMVRENIVSVNYLIYPLFAVAGEKVANEVKSIPGVYQLSVDKIVEEANGTLRFLKSKIPSNLILAKEIPELAQNS